MNSYHITNRQNCRVCTALSWVGGGQNLFANLPKTPERDFLSGVVNRCPGCPGSKPTYRVARTHAHPPALDGSGWTQDSRDREHPPVVFRCLRRSTSNIGLWFCPPPTQDKIGGTQDKICPGCPGSNPEVRNLGGLEEVKAVE